jgi:hypothetical protein
VRTDVGVEKYPSGEEMSAAAVVTGAADGFERLLRHCARYWKLAPRVFPRGVFAFRSIEEAQQAREAVTRENARRQSAGDRARR